MENSELDSETYQALLNSGMNIGTQQDKMAYMQKLAAAVKDAQSEANQVNQNYGRSTLGSSIVPRSGALGAVSNIASGALQGYSAYKGMQGAENIRGMQNDQNSLVLRALQKMRGGQGSGMTSTGMAGGMEGQDPNAGY